MPPQFQPVAPTAQSEIVKPAVDIKTSIDAILNEHRKGRADIDRAVGFLERVESSLRSSEQRQDFFLTLLLVFQQEPFHSSAVGTYFNVHAVIIRVWVKRGSPDELVSHVFEHLSRGKQEDVKGWLQFVLPEIIYSLGNYPRQFPRSARDSFNALCNLYGSWEFETIQSEEKDALHGGIERIRDHVERIVFLEMQDHLPAAESESRMPVIKSKGNKVFIVHGHDDGAKQAVARFIEKLGLQAIILHEQAGGGRTLIEKFEGHSSVDFAIVLLTPDDVGATSDSPKDLKPRARQNVIFELGYFFAKLGRSNVCALYKDVEAPSDIAGVVYIELDSKDAWRNALAREIKHAGLDFEPAKVLS